MGLFASHCVVGVFGIGYFTYKTFLNRNENVYDKTSKSFRTKSPLFKNLCKTVSHNNNIGRLVFIFHDFIRVYPQLPSFNIKLIFTGKNLRKNISQHDQSWSIIPRLLYFPDDGVFWYFERTYVKDSHGVGENQGPYSAK